MKYILIILFILSISVKFSNSTSKYQIPNKRNWLINQNQWFNDILSDRIVEAVPNASDIESDDAQNTFIEFFRKLTFSLYGREEYVLPIVLEKIWHTIELNETAAHSNAVSQPFLTVLLDVVDESIVLYDKQNTRAPLIYIHSLTSVFRDAVNELRADKSNTTLQEQVRLSFEDLEAALLEQLQVNDDGFRKNDFLLQQMPIFTIAATSHLFLLNEVVRFGASWGYSAEIVTYRGRLADSIREYQEYVSDTYSYALDERIFEDVEDWGDLNVDDYETIIQFKNAFIQSVSDFSRDWWMLDAAMSSPSTNGSYSERIRYLFSDIIGFNVDQPSAEEIENYIFTNYYRPSLDRMRDLASQKQIERFRGLISSASFEYGERQYIYSLKTFFNNDVAPFPDAQQEIGDSPDTESSLSVVKFRSNFATQSVRYSHDVFPRMIAFRTAGNSSSSRFGGLDLKSRCIATGTKACKNYYNDNRGSLFNQTSSFINHKIGNVFAWNLNEQVERYPVLDALTVAFLPSEVFANNLIVKSKASVVDAQKYQSIGYSDEISDDDDTDSESYVQFVKDYNGMAGSNALLLSNQSKITYRFDSEYSVATQFSIALHCTLYDKRSSSVTMYDHNQSELAIFNLAYNPFSQILYSTTHYNITLNPKETNNDFTFIVNGGQVVLQHLVLTPYVNN